MTAIAKVAAHAHSAKMPSQYDAGEFPGGEEWHFALRGILLPRALDDAGAMCAALMKGGRVGGLGRQAVAPVDRQLLAVRIDEASSGSQDGTLARNRPLPNSLWLDDLYMSVPVPRAGGQAHGRAALLRRRCAKQITAVLEPHVRQGAAACYMHAWVQDMQHHPAFHWARANGWAIMAMAEVVRGAAGGSSVARRSILALYPRARRRTHRRAGSRGPVASAARPARVVRGDLARARCSCSRIARGINRGWLDPLAFGPRGVVGLERGRHEKVNAKGQVEGTCVGTGVGWDPMFYMYRAGARVGRARLRAGVSGGRGR